MVYYHIRTMRFDFDVRIKRGYLILILMAVLIPYRVQKINAAGAWFDHIRARSLCTNNNIVLSITVIIL